MRAGWDALTSVPDWWQAREAAVAEEERHRSPPPPQQKQASALAAAGEEGTHIAAGSSCTRLLRLRRSGALLAGPETMPVADAWETTASTPDAGRRE